MLAYFYIPRLSNDMKIDVQKNHLGGQILYRRLDPQKKRCLWSIDYGSFHKDRIHDFLYLFGVLQLNVLVKATNCASSLPQTTKIIFYFVHNFNLSFCAARNRRSCLLDIYRFFIIFACKYLGKTGEQKRIENDAVFLLERSSVHASGQGLRGIPSNRKI